MSERKIYVVSAERDGSWWFLRVPELPGVLTQAKRLTEAHGMARDAIGLMLGVSPDSFDVELRIRLGSDADELLTQAREARKAANEATARASRLTAGAIRTLLQKGLTLRDAGTLMGVSFQRAQQLAKDPSATPSRKPSSRISVPVRDARG